MVDVKTRSLLAKAKSSDEIIEILDHPSVQFLDRAQCLRHPLKPGGCLLPINMDLVSC